MIRFSKYLILFSILLAIISCSKEEEEVKLAPVPVINYDNGRLMIKMTGDASLRLDSVIYTNLTKGFEETVSLSSIGYSNGADLSLLSQPVFNGNTGDQVRCCVYLKVNNPIAISFQEVHFDSLQMTTISAGVHCMTGTY